MSNYLPVLVLAAVVVACHQAPVPTPRIERPTLERRTVTIAPAKAGQILSAPQAAFVLRAGVPGVFVVRQGVARFQMVRTGRMVGGSVEILSGLAGGEVLVVGDLAQVHDGSPLKPKG